MAVNLRLRPDAEAALRAAAARTGRSQQELLRDAVDGYLGLSPTAPATRTAGEALVAAGTALPPRSPYRESTRRITLPAGLGSGALLARDDRF